MKILKFIGVMFLVLALTLAIPFYYLHHIYVSSSSVEVLDEDYSKLEGLPKYIATIVNNSDTPQEIKQNVGYILQDFQEKAESRNTYFRTLILIIGIILGIFVLTTGIALKSTEKKLIGNAILTSGILTILAYAIDYIIFIKFF